MRTLITRTMLPLCLLLPGLPVWAQGHVHTPLPEAPVHPHAAPQEETAVHQHEAPPQETPAHQHEEPPHQHPVPDPAVPAHAHQAADSAQQSPLRDPHGYSGGYERHHGPYLAAPDAQMDMSDGKRFPGLRVERLETLQDGEAALEGWAWYGDSYRRLLLRGKAVMEGGEMDEAALDLVGSRAVHPFWDLYGGLGVQAHEDVSRSHALFGLKGLAPYWFELDASLSLDERGRAGLKVEAEYEWLLTQRLVLQPRADFSAYSRADPALALGEGASELVLGLRLRYEFSRRFAPYVGLERTHWLGQSADLRPPGEPGRDSRWVFGLRFWF